MASSSTLIQPTPKQIVRALAGATPADLSKSPLLGILGVIMGAGIVTLTGLLLSQGLADLKGHLGIGFDDGAMDHYLLQHGAGFHRSFHGLPGRADGNPAHSTDCSHVLHFDLRVSASHSQL